ncbi:MAG TPA: hypothetical protein VI387_07710 [Candidatus Brocadiales bacterium]|nr:hypothetical protein [Candidatus Brocadiales bacterium]
MKSIRQIGKVSTCLFFVLSMAIYNFQAGTAFGNGVSYTTDIQPLFTTNGAWHNYDNTSFSFFACTACHNWDGVDEEEGCDPACYHLMNLGTHAGMLNGADGGSIPILGESAVGTTNYNWNSSVLRKRLRNNRMPPQFPFRLDESNRDGPDLYLGRDPVPDGYTAINIPGKFKILLNDATQELAYADEAGDSRGNAVGLIGAWVDDGNGRGLRKARKATYNGIGVRWRDVKAFFTEPNTWFNGSLACTYCHFSNEEPPSYHAMDLSSPEGIMNGADDGAEPILGEPFVGSTDYDWAESGLRARLRNNRMPPDAPFDLNELTRDGPVLTHPVSGLPVRAVDLIGEWVGNGAPNN